MKQLRLLSALALTCAITASAVAADSIKGNYIESRSCDVWAGFCFSNGELNLTGEEATLAWNVTQGTWNGVNLEGLTVVAVVRASATLGDTEHDAYPAKAILMVDERATAIQRSALIDFAQDAGGKLLEDVIRVDVVPIDMDAANTCSGKDVCATVSAGESVAIEARCFHDADKVCGHEDSIYGPLTEIDNAMPHFTEVDRFTGKGLGVTWDTSGRKSTFIGTFSR